MDKLMPLLRCPSCLAEKAFSTADHTDDTWRPIKNELSGKSIRCANCKTHFPVTHDDIPILWSKELRDVMLDPSFDQNNALKANVVVYNQISDDYVQYSRQEAAISDRMKNLAEMLIDRLGIAPRESPKPYRHLDFGCGPGHVIHWLSDLNMEQVGLDVSLRNLRNTRALTGAHVVLGDAAAMPFANGSFNIVTESSVLHHIKDWKAVLHETARVCDSPGGVILDSEPGRRQMAWSWLARMFFESRYPVYKILSFVDPRKYKFRNIKLAKLDYWKAEIHNQPGKGFPVGEIQEIFRRHSLDCEIIHAITQYPKLRNNPGFKIIILHLLSLKNPWNPKNTSFSVIAHKT